MLLHGSNLKAEGIKASTHDADCYFTIPLSDLVDRLPFKIYSDLLLLIL